MKNTTITSSSTGYVYTVEVTGECATITWLAGEDGDREITVEASCVGGDLVTDDLPEDDHTQLVEVVAAQYPRLRLKLDPDLADGTHWTVLDRPDASLLESIQIWMDSAIPGESITLELIAMSNADVAALPDI